MGEEKMDGWKDALPFYMFRCPIHGIVTAYAMGHRKLLVCPVCIEQFLREARIQWNRML